MLISVFSSWYKGVNIWSIKKIGVSFLTEYTIPTKISLHALLWIALPNDYLTIPYKTIAGRVRARAVPSAGFRGLKAYGREYTSGLPRPGFRCDENTRGRWVVFSLARAYDSPLSQNESTGSCSSQTPNDRWGFPNPVTNDENAPKAQWATIIHYENWKDVPPPGRPTRLFLQFINMFMNWFSCHSNIINNCVLECMVFLILDLKVIS